MSYSSCIYGGLCTGCMSCQSKPTESRDFDHQSDYFASVKEVLEFYGNKPYALFSDLVHYADMFREVNNDFYVAAKNGSVSESEITLAWNEGTEIYERSDVDDWCADDFSSYLGFWDKEFSVMTRIMQKERAARAATIRDSGYKKLDSLAPRIVA